MDSMDDASGNPGSSGLVSKNYTEDEVNTIVSELEKVKKFSQKQSEEIDNLKKVTKNLNDRLRAQERYTRKDSIIIVNPPFDARKVNDVTAETLKFFSKFFEISHSLWEHKSLLYTAQHWKRDTIAVGNLQILIFWWQKQRLLKKDSTSKRKTIPSIEKNIHINEPLPEIEASIANEAKKTRHDCVNTQLCSVSACW